MNQNTTSAVVEPADRHLPQNVAELLIDYFLRDELGVKYAPSVTLENQGEGESESHIWAFWIEENDTTSYLGEDGRIQWFGTAWTPDTPKPHQVAELAGDLTDAQLVAVRAENELEAISIPAFRCAARAGIEADRKLRQEPPDDSLTIAYMSGRADGKSSAQAALAAKDATHEKQLNAHKSLIQSLENQRTTLREGAEKWAEAVKSLLSEREANAILTSEIAKLCTERDMWASEYERQIDAKRGLAEELAALTAERDALKVDAERYRWLRSAADVMDGEFFVGVDSIDHCGEWALSGAESDEAIDAAMLAQAVKP